MTGRSQRHMREFYEQYDADASGQAQPVLLSAIPDQNLGTTVSVDFSSYFRGYPRTYSATGLPTGTSISATTGVVSGTATPGSYNSSVITVTNGYGTASDTINWTIS